MEDRSSRTRHLSLAGLHVSATAALDDDEGLCTECWGMLGESGSDAEKRSRDGRLTVIDAEV